MTSSVAHGLQLELAQDPRQDKRTATSSKVDVSARLRVCITYTVKTVFFSHKTKPCRNFDRFIKAADYRHVHDYWADNLVDVQRWARFIRLSGPWSRRQIAARHQGVSRLRAKSLTQQSLSSHSSLKQNKHFDEPSCSPIPVPR